MGALNGERGRYNTVCRTPTGPVSGGGGGPYLLTYDLSTRPGAEALTFSSAFLAVCAIALRAAVPCPAASSE